MPSWKLDNQQRVYVDRHCNVHFQHYHNNIRNAISLRWRQFLNLNDVVMDLDTFENIKYYPLGKNLWLQQDEDCIELYHCKRKRYFLFHERSWRKYLRETHRLILSFIRHEALPRHQHAASNAALLQGRSGRNSSPTTQQQILPRTSPDARSENEQWKKHANVSEWNSSNSGSDFSFSSSINALRATTDLTSEMEEGEVCSIELDREQFSDFESLQ